MRLIVLYGSQTGTAQDVAEQIWRESKKYGFEGPVLAMDDFGIEKLIETQLVIFVVATTGNGEEPDSMKKSWKFLLRKNLPTDVLRHLRFACLGLGDSSYTKFNFAAKKLNKRLCQLGATQIQPLGLCDDQHDYGLGAVSLIWIGNLWKELGKSFNLRVASELNSIVNNIFKWQVEVVRDAIIPKNVDQGNFWSNAEAPARFIIKKNKRVTSEDHFQEVRLISLDVPNAVTWLPGDCLQVLPCNRETVVKTFFRIVDEHMMDFSESTVVHVNKAHNDMPVPTNYLHFLTMRQVVKYCWDLTTTPRQRFFELLSLNCEDELEKEKLNHFTSFEGLEDLNNYVSRQKRSILEVLQDFRYATSKLTMSILFEMMPLIQKRSFSIASIKSSGSLDLLVAVVKYKTKLSELRLGLCSNWMKELTESTIIPGCIRQGTFQMPKNFGVPLIMVGPGTGIAPIRAMVQERLATLSHGINVGSMMIFFGCRHQAKDFYFSEDFQNWRNYDNVEVFIAFSRDQEHKIYVQHLITDNYDMLKDFILNKEAVIMVAGSSNNMPKAVKEAFLQIVDNNENFLENMIKDKRYQEETWS